MAKLREIDRRWIFLCVAAALLITVRYSFKQPITPSPSVKSVYDYIQKLPPGSAVLIATDFDPSAKAELEPMTQALLEHCFKRNLRVIGMTFWYQGLTLANRIFKDVATRYGKTSGVDYAFLGFKYGDAGLIITGMGESFTSVFPQDAGNEPTVNMQIFREVKSLRDVRYMIDIAAGVTVGTWIIFGSDKFSIPMAAGCTAVSAPDYYVFTNTGQLNGIIGGLRGAADYEVLLRQPGLAVSGMAAQSTVHAIIVLFVIVGNVVYFWGRRARGRRTEPRP
jgi:hypothetical protein